MAAYSVSIGDGGSYQGVIMSEPGLAQYFRLDDAVAAGGTAIDWKAVANGTYGSSTTPNQASLLGSGVGASCYFAGLTNGRITVGLTAAGNPWPSFSLEAWIKPEVLSTQAGIINLGRSASAYGAMIYFDSSFKPRLQVNGAGVTASTTAPATALVAGNLYHIVGTFSWNGTNSVTTGIGTLTLYVNGVQVSQVTTSSATAAIYVQNVTNSTLLGLFGTSTYLQGWMDEAAIYSTALSSAQVLNHYNLGIVAANSASRVFNAARPVSESAPAVDTFTRGVTYIRPVSESAPATDAFTRAFGTVRSISESAPAVDAFTRAFGTLRSISESAPAVDAFTRLTAIQRKISESAPATDTFARSATTKTISISESAPAVDSWSRLYGIGRLISESAPASDSWGRRMASARALLENAPATGLFGWYGTPYQLQPSSVQVTGPSTVGVETDAKQTTVEVTNT